jgi:hypothetical protein
VQLRDGLHELFAMEDIILRNAADARSKFAQDAREQAATDVHVNRFADVLGAGRVSVRANPVGSR